ncbi:KLRB1 protein, partial [Aegotheles bennettii]|nr:KLRB1 protein [Aegotheles bennettii]
LNHILQKPSRYFWLGLSAPSAEEGWTWLNGSHPDQSRPWERGDGACGVLRGDRIGSSSCTSRLQWICQKEATKL